MNTAWVELAEASIIAAIVCAALVAFCAPRLGPLDQLVRVVVGTTPIMIALLVAPARVPRFVPWVEADRRLSELIYLVTGLWFAIQNLRYPGKYHRVVAYAATGVLVFALLSLLATARDKHHWRGDAVAIGVLIAAFPLTLPALERRRARDRAAYAARPVRRSRPRWAGRCSSCGYDLRGLGERRCPECGRPFNRPAPAARLAPGERP